MSVNIMATFTKAARHSQRTHDAEPPEPVARISELSGEARFCLTLHT